ncbi:MAG: hypothetical protein WCF81_05555 [Roseiarcus sp.]
MPTPKTMRAAITASLVAAVALTLPVGLSLTEVRAGALSPADKYVECVKREASESAGRHVGDVEVARSRVPDKVLRELASRDISHACLSQFEALDRDDTVETSMRFYDLVGAAIGKALADAPPQRQPPPPGSDDYEHGEKLAAGAQEWLSAECRALLDTEHYIAPASCAEAVREANQRQKAEEDAGDERFARMPEAQSCLGIKNVTDPSQRSQLALQRIKAMTDDEFEKVSKCVQRMHRRDADAQFGQSPIVQYCIGYKEEETQPGGIRSIT